MRVLAAMMVVAALAAGVGCGGGGGESLTPDEDVTVSGFNVDVALTVLDGSAYGELLDSMEAVIALAREKPDAEYDGRTMSQVLADAASELQPYQPDLAAELDRAVATLE